VKSMLLMISYELWKCWNEMNCENVEMKCIVKNVMKWNEMKCIVS